MRLSREFVQHLAETIVASLEARNLAGLGLPRPAVVAKIAEIITADLQTEDQLNRDVEKVLAAYEEEIATGNMDRRKVFELTKQKLAKERGIVL